MTYPAADGKRFVRQTEVDRYLEAHTHPTTERKAA